MDVIAGDLSDYRPRIQRLYGFSNALHFFFFLLRLRSGFTNIVFCQKRSRNVEAKVLHALKAKLSCDGRHWFTLPGDVQARLIDVSVVGNFGYDVEEISARFDVHACVTAYMGRSPLRKKSTYDPDFLVSISNGCWPTRPPVSDMRA